MLFRKKTGRRRYIPASNKKFRKKTVPARIGGHTYYFVKHTKKKPKRQPTRHGNVK